MAAAVRAQCTHGPLMQMPVLLQKTAVAVAYTKRGKGLVKLNGESASVFVPDCSTAQCSMCPVPLWSGSMFVSESLGARNTQAAARLATAANGTAWPAQQSLLGRHPLGWQTSCPWSDSLG